MKFLSVTLPQGDPAIGDTSAEAEEIFRLAAERLESDGMSFRDVLHTRFFYSDASDFEPMAAVRARFYAETFVDLDFPGSSGLVSGPRDDGGQNLEIEFVAGVDKKAFMAITDTTSGPVVTSPYRHANTAEGLVYVSGFLGSRGDDTATQFDHSARNLRNAFAGAGAALTEVLSISVYISPVTDAAVVSAKLDTLIATECGGTIPVASIICVHELSFEGFLVAIEAVAASGGMVRSSTTRSGLVGELDVPLPLHADATEANGWVFATGAAHPNDSGASIAEVFAAAVTELTAGIAELVPLTNVQRATVWFAPQSIRAEVLALAAAEFGTDGADVTCFPLSVPAASGPIVRLQVTSKIPEGE